MSCPLKSLSENFYLTFSSHDNMANNLPSIPCVSSSNDSFDELLSKYFEHDFTYLEIKEFLKVHYEYNVSLSTIKRHLKKMNLFKRPLAGRRISRTAVSELVREELLASG